MKIAAMDIYSLRNIYKAVRHEFLTKYGELSGFTKEQFDAATKGSTPLEWTQNAIDKLDFWNDRVADWNGDWDVE